MSNENLEDYRQQVKLTTEHAIGLIKDENGIPRSEAIFEACDGFPIKYSDILNTIQHSNTSPADIEKVPTNDCDDNWDVLVRMAFRLYERDVRNRVNKILD